MDHLFISDLNVHQPEAEYRHKHCGYVIFLKVFGMARELQDSTRIDVAMTNALSTLTTLENIQYS